jgi:uncharacterized membrane protein
MIPTKVIIKTIIYALFILAVNIVCGASLIFADAPRWQKVISLFGVVILTSHISIHMLYLIAFMKSMRDIENEMDDEEESNEDK